jgi:hypothetical protein
MANDTPHRREVITCPHCQTAQAVHVEQVLTASSLPLESVMCVNEKCQRIFDMPYPSRVVGGPWRAP